MSKVVSNKEEDMTNVAFGDVVLESFKKVRLAVPRLDLLFMRKRRWVNGMNLLLSLERKGSWFLFEIEVKEWR